MIFIAPARRLLGRPLDAGRGRLREREEISIAIFVALRGHSAIASVPAARFETSEQQVKPRSAGEANMRLIM